MSDKFTHVEVYPKSESEFSTIRLKGEGANLSLGGSDSDSILVLYDKNGSEVIKLMGFSGGYIVVRDITGEESILLDGGKRNVTLRDTEGRNSITLDGTKGDVILFDEDHHHSFSLHGKVGDYTGLWIGANESEGKKPGKIFLRGVNGDHSIDLDGKTRKVTLYDNDKRSSVIIDGEQGDIILNKADCAEDFDLGGPESFESGTVMVIGEQGKLEQSNLAYDRRVAGVISGAGNYKPGLILDKRQSHEKRISISLVGKVYCKVDANSSTIDVGDMLTTSDTPGHAMKVQDPSKAFGAVIGKSLERIESGKGLIPILIALQ